MMSLLNAVALLHVIPACYTDEAGISVARCVAEVDLAYSGVQQYKLSHDENVLSWINNVLEKLGLTGCSTLVSHK